MAGSCEEPPDFIQCGVFQDSAEKMLTCQEGRCSMELGK